MNPAISTCPSFARIRPSYISQKRQADFYEIDRESMPVSRILNGSGGGGCEVKIRKIYKLMNAVI